MKEQTAVSLDSLNVAKQCESAFEFEYINESGSNTGVFLTVIGSHAPELQKWVNSELNKRRNFEAMQTKRGKDSVRLIEDDIDFGVELIALRIKGWRGINEPFTPENALRLCEINPLIVEQVKAASENLANFTPSK